MRHVLSALLGGGLGAYCVWLKLSVWIAAGIFGFAFGFYFLGIWAATTHARNAYLNHVREIAEESKKP